MSFSHERDSFDDALDDIADVQQGMKQLTQRLRACVFKEHNRTKAQKSLADAFLKLAKEVDDALAASFLVETHQLLTSSSCIAEGRLVTDLARLVDPMEDQTGMHEAIFFAFSNRRDQKTAFLADFEELIEQRRTLKDDYDAYFATSGGTLVGFMRLSSAHEDLEKLTQKNAQRKEELMRSSDVLLAEYRLLKDTLWLEAINNSHGYFTRQVSMSRSLG